MEMDEARTVAALVDRIRHERAALDAAVAGLTDDLMAQPGPAGQWSAKDILAHVTWWEHRLLEKLRGEPTAHDQLGGVDNDARIEAVNDSVYHAHRDQPAAYRAALPALTAGLTSVNATTVLAQQEFIADNTWRHYPEHAAQIRAWREHATG
jgi:uncharacterized protein (TIGR03083 family)